jgi:lipopolysaccharide/colanic/teichoic acid biosynthesis glycosyltransferase
MLKRLSGHHGGDTMSAIAAEEQHGADPPRSGDVLVLRLHVVAGPSGRLQGACKWALDFFLALGLLVLTAPLVLATIVLIKITSRGPILYTQTRLGKNGKPFVIYKLRTMVHRCEWLTGPRWSTPGDPRITPLGRVLRKTHIDELPQLWNVLCGDMSLVGPRPERPEFVPQLEQAIAHYRARMLVKPGLTGLAQVQLPPDTNLASVRLKLAYDLHYVQHGGWWLDCRIILGTAFKMLGCPFEILRRIFGYPLRVNIQRDYQLLAPDQKVAETRVQTA